MVDYEESSILVIAVKNYEIPKGLVSGYKRQNRGLRLRLAHKSAFRASVLKSREAM